MLWGPFLVLIFYFCGEVFGDQPGSVMEMFRGLFSLHEETV